jgi:hypothetical protein
LENAPFCFLEEMGKQIDANLRMHQDKKALVGLQGEKLNKARENANFFDSIEGLFALNESDAVGRLYVTASPKFGLARVMKRGLIFFSTKFVFGSLAEFSFIHL